MATRHTAYRQQEFIAPYHRLVIIMVGLPARGKSYMAKKIYRYLRHLQLITKVFNAGSYRRIATKDTTVGKASAKFFDPDNADAVKIREQCCLAAINDLVSWFNTGGQVGILDATNTTSHRRQLIRQFFAKKESELEYNVSLLYIESICNDESIIQNNIISVKLKNPDYCTVDAAKALQDFNERIKMYKKKYVEVGKDEGSYIKVINVGTEVTGYLINDYISCRILYFLMHLHLHTHNKKQKKPLLMQLKNVNEAKTDKEMEDKLEKIAKSVGAKFRRPAYDVPVHALGPWMRRPSYLMWNEAEDTYKDSPNPQKSHTTSPPLFNKTPAHDLAHHPSRQSSIPSSIPSSIQESVSPMIKQRPKVRKSTTLLRIISARELDLNPVDNQDKSRASTSNLAALSGQTTASGSGYNSDIEEDEDSQLTQISDHGQKFKRHKINHNKDVEKKTDNDDDNNLRDNDDFNCELCGRVVPKKNTSLVDSVTNENEKIRICEVCLYESDSEEDTTADESGFLEAMESGPQSIVQTRSTSPERVGSIEQLNNVKSKTRKMSQSISNLLSHLDTNGDIKQELIRIQQDMKQLFND